MKFFIPTVILSFALGFFCNEFLTNRNVEKINPIDPITLLAENSQAEKKEHHTLIIDDEVNTNLNVQSKRNQKQITPNKLTIDQLIDLATKQAISQENTAIVKDTIADLSLEEQKTLHTEIISQLPNKNLHNLLRLITKSIIVNDPTLLVDLIRNSQPEGGAIVAKEGFSILAEKSLEDAWNLASSLGPGSKESLLNNDELRATRFSILTGLSKNTSNLSELFDFTSSQKGRDKLTYLSNVISISAQQDLISTRQHIMNLPAGESKNRAVSMLMQTWSDKNADEAMDWLIDNPELADKYTMIRTAEQLLKQDGTETFSEYYRNTDSNEVKLQLASAAAQYYSNSDLQKSIEWLKTMNNPREQSSAVYSTLRTMGYEQNMGEHIHLLESLYDDNNSNQAKFSYRGMLSEWSKYQPEQVRFYVENLPAEKAELKKYLTNKLKLN